MSTFHLFLDSKVERLIYFGNLEPASPIKQAILCAWFICWTVSDEVIEEMEEAFESMATYYMVGYLDIKKLYDFEG